MLLLLVCPRLRRYPRLVPLFLCAQVITTALNMDENVAGVTFLAFGNGAADIFSLVLLVLRGDGDADDDDDVTGVAGMGSILGGREHMNIN